jgi:hypothetical protein
MNGTTCNDCFLCAGPDEHAEQLRRHSFTTTCSVLYYKGFINNNYKVPVEDEGYCHLIVLLH